MAGLKGFLPSPPKVILAMAMATKAPMTTIHQGIVEGRLKASSTPVTTADQLEIVSGPRTRKRWMRNSKATHEATESAVTRSTSRPKTTVETTSAGISARTTSRMIDAVDCGDCTCGAGATVSLFIILMVFCQFTFWPRRHVRGCVP